MNHINSLSDLMQCPIIKHDGIAEIIIDHIDPNDFPIDIQDWGKPVRLFGYAIVDKYTDFEIYEDAWEYYQEFKEEIEKAKRAR